jgi:hypothetical protein
MEKPQGPSSTRFFSFSDMNDEAGPGPDPDHPYHRRNSRSIATTMEDKIRVSVIKEVGARNEAAFMALREFILRHFRKSTTEGEEAAAPKACTSDDDNSVVAKDRHLAMWNRLEPIIELVHDIYTGDIENYKRLEPKTKMLTMIVSKLHELYMLFQPRCSPQLSVGRCPSSSSASFILDKVLATVTFVCVRTMSSGSSSSSSSTSALTTTPALNTAANDTLQHNTLLIHLITKEILSSIVTVFLEPANSTSVGKSDKNDT